MTNNAHNLIVLREAQRTIDNFERIYGLSTDEMLNAAEGDERLAGIDGFELMDWHFAVDQRNALGRIVGSIHAVADEDRLSLEDHFSFSSQYQMVSPVVLINMTERELDLVA